MKLVTQIPVSGRLDSTADGRWHQTCNTLLTLCTLRAEMSQTELVAMLRSRARKSGTQTSHYRGVSLLKQTGKWHAQINVGGKQVGSSHCKHALQASMLLSNTKPFPAP